MELNRYSEDLANIESCPQVFQMSGACGEGSE